MRVKGLGVNPNCLATTGDVWVRADCGHFVCSRVCAKGPVLQVACVHMTVGSGALCERRSPQHIQSRSQQHIQSRSHQHIQSRSPQHIQRKHNVVQKVSKQYCLKNLGKYVSTYSKKASILTVVIVCEQVPDNGKVGVIGSGKGLTEYKKQKRHEFTVE